MSDIVKYDNIFQYNEARGVETLHPLVSVIDFSVRPATNGRSTGFTRSTSKR